MDFEIFFNQWYYGEGYPIYDIVWYYDDGNTYLNIAQSTSASITPLFEMTMEYKLKFDDGTDTLVRLYQDANVKNFVVPVSKKVTSIQVDPNNWTFERVNSITVNISEHNHPNYFTFSPNPAADWVNIYLLNDHGSQRTLLINDVTGRLVSRDTFSGGHHQIYIGELPPGVYLMQISDGRQVFTRRLIK
jgi:aminopeptidase N